MTTGACAWRCLMSRWKARHLLGAWAVYWIALVLVKLGYGLFADVPRAGRAGGHGKIDVEHERRDIHAPTSSAIGLHWTGSASLMSIVLWLCGPPLLLWLLWLVTRRAPARGARCRA